MKIILPTSIILAAIILAIGLFAFGYYENNQIRKSCETIVSNMNFSDVQKNILINLEKEVDIEFSWDDWRSDKKNKQKHYSFYNEEKNKRLNKKISKYLKSQEEKNIEECILNNS